MYGVDIVGTDKTTSLNAVTAVAPTGILEGTLMPLKMEKYGPKAPVALMARDLSLGRVISEQERHARSGASGQRTWQWD